MRKKSDGEETNEKELFNVITDSMKEWLKTQIELNKLVEEWKPALEEYNYYLDRVSHSMNMVRDVMSAFNEIIKLNGRRGDDVN